jgi:hypothetical protein
MLIVKAYSVRLAEARNSHLAAATAHLTCRMPIFPALRLLGRTQDDSSPLYWFYDPRQNLYLTAEQSALPANMVGPILLMRNCRNTRRISQRCGLIVGEEFLPLEHTPEGEDVREVFEASLKDVIKTVREQVLRWTERGGRLRPSQIAILTPQDPGGDWPKQIGTVPLGDDFDRWRRTAASMGWRPTP